MKLILLIFPFLFSLMMNKSKQNQQIFVGEKFLGHRVIILDFNQNEIIAEVGGTSLKMGGDIIILKKKRNDTNSIFASSGDNKCQIVAKNTKFVFKYDGVLGKKEFCLKYVEYTSKIEQIRLNIFKWHFFNNKINDVDIEFNKYKENQFQYLQDK